MLFATVKDWCFFNMLVTLFISKLFFALKYFYMYTTFTGTNIQTVHLQIQYTFKSDRGTR